MDRTALILEDSRTQAQIIGKMIEGLGWSPIHFETMRDACEGLTQMAVHALFLDVFVGQHNSLLHVDRFRKLAPSAPIVLMTAGSSKDAIEETLAQARRTGADFVLRKPFNEALLTDILTTAESNLTGGKRKRHILVIDDSRTVRMIAARAFESGGYRVSQAESMEQAFADIDIAHVDVVLCDVFMPGMGGFAGMRTIKTTWPKVRIISMSGGLEAKVSEQDALNATRRIGADAQIRKPFDAQDLLQVTAALLEAA